MKHTHRRLLATMLRPIAVGNTPQFIGPQDMLNKLRADLDRYAQVVKQANLKID